MKGFWRLLSYIKNYKRQVILSAVSNILTAVFTVVSIPLIIPFFQILFGQEAAVSTGNEALDEGLVTQLKMYFVNIIETSGKGQALLMVCIMIAVVFFLKNLFRYLSLYFMAPVRNGIVRNIRSSLFQKYLTLPLAFHTEERKGDLLSRITSDVQEVEWSILNVIEAIFKSPLIIIGSIGFMIYVSPQLTVFVFILLLFTGLIIGSISKVLKKQSKEVQRNLAMINTVVEESLSGLRVIKSFNAESAQNNTFEKYNGAYESSLTTLLRRRDLSSPMSEFLGISVVTVLLWYGSNQVFKSELTPDTFFAFVLAFYQVIEPSKAFTSAYYNIQKGLAAVDRIDTIIQTQNDIINIDEPQYISTFENSIHLDNISFSYENDTKVIDHLNIEVKKGEIVALVGSSGSGKSTIVNLLPRFYDVQDGSIRIDGIDIKEIDLVNLREQFGIVNQDTVLFHDTVYNNIVFGLSGITQERVKEAARVAFAHDFISTLSEGYETKIGDRGVKLSGGQRQRIAIARAVLRNPPIFILDEATSALDAESEELVQLALDHLMKGRTAIVVAHRLSTVKNANRILVLDNGKVVEEGSHQELIDKKGIYQKLVEKQSFLL